MGFQEVHGNLTRSILGHCQRCRFHALSASCAPRVRDSSHGINWKLQSLADSAYHMVYLTVAHGIRHGSTSENITTTYTIISGVMMEGHENHWKADSTSGIPLLNLRQRAHGHLCLSTFMDEIMIFRAHVPLLRFTGSPYHFCNHTQCILRQSRSQTSMCQRASFTSSIVCQLDSKNEKERV